MLPQSSKKGIGTLRQTTGRYPTCVCAKLLENIICKQIMSHFFEKQNFNTCTTWLSIKTLMRKPAFDYNSLMNLFKILKARHKPMLLS